MGIVATCGFCKKTYSAEGSLCPHCYRQGTCPNVLLAEQDQQALQQRYDKAGQNAAQRGVAHLFQQLYESVDRDSRACVNMGYLEVRGLLKKNGAYAGFYQQLKAGVRRLTSDSWETDREQTDTLFFPYFKENILFAALTLDDRGVPYYGACCLLIDSAMIQQRASLYHENTVVFYIRNGRRGPVPEGYRATWARRGMLAAAKVEAELSPATSVADFPRLLVRPDLTGQGEDTFLEVHIFGIMTIETVKEITFPANPAAEADKKDADLLAEELQARNKIAYRRC